MFDRIELRTNPVSDRFGFIRSELGKIAPCDLLDVGAGEKPFQLFSIERGFNYQSHDFEKYDGDGGNPGLQNTGWNNSGHQIVSDILEIPAKKYGVILLTEVLEHVPDPVAALRKCSELLASNGTLLITVPFASRMHQAPFWFSSGLSPYWFHHHAQNLDFKVNKILLLGNFYDMFLAEGQQFFGCFGVKKFNLGRLFQSIFTKLRRILEPRIPKSLLDSGALGVFVVLVKE